VDRMTEIACFFDLVLEELGKPTPRTVDLPADESDGQSNSDSSKKWVCQSDAANRLGISRSTLSNAIRTNKNIEQRRHPEPSNSCRKQVEWWSVCRAFPGRAQAAESRK